MAKIVKVHQNVNGMFVLALMWGEGDCVDREIHPDHYNSLADAERVAKCWAQQQEADYIPFKKEDPEARKREIDLVIQLRKEKGLDLQTAIKQAREQIHGS